MAKHGLGKHSKVGDIIVHQLPEFIQIKLDRESMFANYSRVSEKGSAEQRPALTIFFLVNQLGSILLLFVSTHRTLVGQEEGDTDRVRCIIEWSAVEPRVEFLARDTAGLSKLPFQGCVTVFVADDGTELVWNLWKQRRFTQTDFSKNEESLKVLASRPREFALLARFNMPTEAYDWLDDQRWDGVLSNASLVAQLAQCGRFQGIMLDTEQYGEQIFRIDPQKSELEIAILKQTVKERGEDWIKTIQNHLSRPWIVITFGYRATTSIGDGRPNIHYGLLESFLDGIVEGARSETRLIDGWEYAYGYKKESQFQQAKERFDQIQAMHPNRSKIRLGFGLWMDFDPDNHPWETVHPEQNYFNPNSFAESIRYARTYGNGLVWIYSQRPNWWTGEKLPREYVIALEQISNTNP